MNACGVLTTSGTYDRDHASAGPLRNRETDEQAVASSGPSRRRRLTRVVGADRSPLHFTPGERRKYQRAGQGPLPRAILEDDD
jgi:hypothetical protein